jgi:polyadenylate-binding protein
VNFKSPDSAAAAIEKLNGTTVNGDKVLFVARAQSKAEREQELKAKLEQERLCRYEKLQRANLYLKNLDDDFTNENLKDMFSKYGTITSCKVC